MAASENSPQRIGIGLLGRNGCYLIRQRRPGQIMAGVWEFPGGKCEPGEDPADATQRECLEEVGLLVVAERLHTRFEHTYPHGRLELSYYVCRTVDPRAEPDADSGFVWVRAVDLSRYAFPGANEPVIAALVAESSGFFPS